MTPFKKQYPALREALWNIATPQIRNMCTLGGNLCSRPHCWYYRFEHFDCLKKGGKTCPAIEGDNEFHAIFGTSEPCVMVHPSSAAPALIAYGAKFVLAGPKGPTTVDAEKFFTLPNQNPTRENVLSPQQLLTQIILPHFKGVSASYEVRHKESHDWPIALASVALAMAEGKIQSRICLGGVAPIPWRVREAEQILNGESQVTEKLAQKVAEKSVENARPLSGNRYKIQIAKTCVQRAILAAATGERI